MKRQKDMTLEDDPTMSESAQYATGEEQRAITNSSRKKKRLGQSRNDPQLWMCIVEKGKSDAIKNNITQEPGMLGPWIKKGKLDVLTWQEWASTS